MEKEVKGEAGVGGERGVLHAEISGRHLGEHVELSSADQGDREEVIGRGGIVEGVETHLVQVIGSVQNSFTIGLRGEKWTGKHRQVYEY